LQILGIAAGNVLTVFRHNGYLPKRNGNKRSAYTTVYATDFRRCEENCAAPEKACILPASFANCLQKDLDNLPPLCDKMLIEKKEGGDAI
jgi:hypothetical protein